MQHKYANVYLWSLNCAFAIYINLQTLVKVYENAVWTHLQEDANGPSLPKPVPSLRPNFSKHCPLLAAASAGEHLQILEQILTRLVPSTIKHRIWSLGNPTFWKQQRKNMKKNIIKWPHDKPKWGSSQGTQLSCSGSSPSKPSKPSKRRPAKACDVEVVVLQTVAPVQKQTN